MVRWMSDFGSILAVPGTDDAGDVVAARATALARAGSAALTFVDVIADDGVGADDVAARRTQLASLADAARRDRIDASEAVLHGDVAVEIIKMVLREGHDLVIAGPGRAAEALVRDCPCPVLVEKPAGFETPVTLDGAGTGTG